MSFGTAWKSSSDTLESFSAVSALACLPWERMMQETCNGRASTNFSYLVETWDLTHEDQGPTGAGIRQSCSMPRSSHALRSLDSQGLRQEMCQHKMC